MAVPWTQIIRWAPQIIGVSRELLQRSRQVPKAPAGERDDGRADHARRIAALEDIERRQAELVERMAEQQAELARAVVELHRRERLLIGAVIALPVLTSLAVWLLLR